MDSLRVQADLALDHMVRGWPVARDEAIAAIGPRASEIEDVILFGCGDSHHAAVALEMAFSTWSGRRVRAAPAMMASRYLIPRLDAGSGGVLLVGISVSGEVARTLEAVESANALKTHTLALTGNRESSLARAAKMNLSLQAPAAPAGPGLLSFLSSLLLGYAVAAALSNGSLGDEIEDCMHEMFEILEPWLEAERESGDSLASKIEDACPLVYLGSGPAHGMAMFAAAKLVEAAGVAAWGQDVEEWAHIEYFAEPANAPTWLLSSGGRSRSREDEIASAALAIDRRWVVSRWQGHARWSGMMREVLSPLALWPGPIAFASRKAALLGEEPFRGFGGGRSQEEGGGASRIRSSERSHQSGDHKK